MDAKFYIKSLNNSPNGGCKGVEGNSEGILRIYNAPNYILINRATYIDEVNTGQIISIDEFSKLKLQDNSIFRGTLIYKEEPIINDFSEIEYKNDEFRCIFGAKWSEISKIKDSPFIRDLNIEDEFLDYYIIFSLT